MRTIYLLCLIVLCAAGISAQPINDDCISAFHLDNSVSWCSDPGQYTNVNATPYAGTLDDPGCFLQGDNEVWFTFIPQTPAVYVRVSGSANGLGTLVNPAIGIFKGPCSALTRIGCNTVALSSNQVELSVESLIIGAVYYLVVEGQNNNVGTFQICLEGFIPPPIPQSDCSKAVILCDKSAFIVDTIVGIGIMDPGVTNTCVMQELSSVWYKWTAETSGTLTFTLTPNNYLPGFISDDIDFVLYELPSGINDCNNKVEARCMAAGANNMPFNQWIRCNGPTGLQEGSTDTSEDAGCEEPDDDSWVAPLNMVAGESYALLVNNFSQTGLGFSIEWGGTGTFQGPEPAFEVTAVQAFECDKTIIFENQSNAPTDSIVSYLWNFGAGAMPQFDTTTGPISVIYDSFGPKRVALTVTSSKGCVVTEILDFPIEPCCADTSTLSVTATTIDQICPGTPSGVIQGIGISGSPEYQYSLDCVDYQPASVFPALLPGVYTLCIQDEKGCESQVDVEIFPASGFGVEAGDTIFVQLGQEATLNAVPFPNLPISVSWTDPTGMHIGSTLDTITLPKRTGWYTVTIVNDAGCTISDSVLIIVDAYKPIYIPNVITPNGDGVNDWLTVYANAAATGIEKFQIFDRWGGLLWEGEEDMQPNDESMGWNGEMKEGKPVNPGAYTYRIVVEFLDEIPVAYTGSVTVVR